MKKYLLVLFTLFIVSFQNPPKIEGKWFVLKFEKQNEATRKINEKWIELLENGRLKGGKTGTDEAKEGIWSFNEKTKTLTIKSVKKDGKTHRSGDDGDYLVEELNENSIILSKDDMRIYLVRSKEE